MRKGVLVGAPEVVAELQSVGAWEASGERVLYGVADGEAQGAVEAVEPAVIEVEAVRRPEVEGGAVTVGASPLPLAVPLAAPEPPGVGDAGGVGDNVAVPMSVLLASGVAVPVPLASPTVGLALTEAPAKLLRAEAESPPVVADGEGLPLRHIEAGAERDGGVVGAALLLPLQAVAESKALVWGEGLAPTEGRGDAVTSWVLGWELEGADERDPSALAAALLVGAGLCVARGDAESAAVPAGEEEADSALVGGGERLPVGEGA